MARSMKTAITTAALGLVVHGYAVASETPGGQGVAAPGAWCSSFEPAARSCVVVRTVEQTSPAVAVLRQVGLQDVGPGERIKLVIELRAELGADQLCYEASGSGVTGLSLYRTDNTAPVVTPDDRPLPPERAARWLKRLARQPHGFGQPRVCWPKPDGTETFFRPADAETLVLRAP